MKYLQIVSLLALSSGVWAQTEMKLAPFTKIELEAPVKVILINGTEPKATHSNSLANYNLEVEGGVLSIELKSKRMVGEVEELSIYFDQLNGIELNGTGEIATAAGSTIKGDRLVMEITGATKANLSLNLSQLNLEANGATKVTLSGAANNSIIEISGASHLNAEQFISKEIIMEASGASVFFVHAINVLQIEAAGAARGTYSGNPVNRNINISGAAKVTDSKTGLSHSEKNMEEQSEWVVNEKNDTTRISIGKKKFIIIEEGDDVKIEKEDGDSDKKESYSFKSKKKKELKHVYAGFEMGMSQLISPDMTFNLPQGYNFLNCNMGKSWFFGLNLFEGDLNLISNKLALTSGLGLEWQNFNFNSNRVLTPNVNIINADSGMLALTTNKLYNFNFNVPLLLKFAPRTKKERNNFHLALGVIGTYKAYSHIRTESSALGYDVETKINDDFNINPFRVSATARIGYGWFRAFANYSLTPYFKINGSNPDIRVFSAGITVIPF